VAIYGFQNGGRPPSWFFENSDFVMAVAVNRPISHHRKPKLEAVSCDADLGAGCCGSAGSSSCQCLLVTLYVHRSRSRPRCTE